MQQLVVGDDHIRVENAIRVKQGLEFLHDPVGCRAPFHFHKGGHIATGAVLGLDRAFVLHRHQLAHRLDKGFVTFDFGLTGKIGREHEVQVTFQRMAEDDGFVVMVLAEQGLQLERAFGQMFDGKHHVFDDDGGFRRTHRAHTGEHALADIPQAGVFLGHIGKANAGQIGNGGDIAANGVDLHSQRASIAGTGFHQDGGSLVAQGFQFGRHPRLVFHRAQAGAVQQLGRGHHVLVLGQQLNGIAGILDGGVQHQRRGLVRQFFHRVVSRLGDKGQCAFAAHNQVQQHVQRIGKIHQRIQAVAGGVFHLVLAADARFQFAIGADTRSQPSQPGQQPGMRLAEGRHTGGIGGIQHRAVGQHQPQALDGLVSVLRRAAAHAAGVVADNAAYHGGIDGGRIGTDLAAKRQQGGIGRRTDYPRLQADGPPFIQDLQVFPAMIGHHQNGIAHCLAGQRSPRRAEGHRQLQRRSLCQHRLHFGLGVCLDDNFRYQPVTGRIRPVGQGGQRVAKYPLGVDHFDNGLLKQPVSTLQHELSPRRGQLLCVGLPRQVAHVTCLQNCNDRITVPRMLKRHSATSGLSAHQGITLSARRFMRGNNREGDTDMLMQIDQATLLVVDIQDKLLPAVDQADSMLAASLWLVGVAHDTGLPIVFSEQYPRGLGHTEASLLALAPQASVVEKLHFSCVAADCLPDSLLARKQVIVCGMETHVCVLQTVLQLLAQGKQVFVVADAVASRRDSDKQLGLQRMQAAGAVLVSREMVLFEMLEVAGSELFKAMSKKYLMGVQP